MKDKPNNNLFNIVLGSLIVLVFLLNHQHLNQSGTYYQVFLQIVENLNSKGQYTYSLFGTESATYPIWGYTVLLYFIGLFTTNVDLFVLIIQGILAFYGINLFYKLFDLNRKWYHLILLLPFIALMSVKWPDAIVGFLLILMAYLFKLGLKDNSTKYFLLSGFVLGLICNFRSEYIFLPLIGLIISILPMFKEYRKKILIGSAISISSIVLLLIPWMIHYHSTTGSISPSASNGSAVAYISLGQLSDNKWGIEHKDQFAFDLAEENGINNPFTHEGSIFFQDKFLEAVTDHPFEYLKKCGNNFLKMLIGGVYTGEYANLAMTEEERLEINQDIGNTSGISGKIEYITNEIEPAQSLSILIEKIIQFAYIPITLMLFVIFFITLFNSKKVPNDVLYLSATIVIFKIIMVSLLQYEYRHINGIYLFLLGIFVLQNFKFSRRIKN